MPQHVRRSLRLTFMAAAMALTLAPTLPASAQCTLNCNTTPSMGANSPIEIQVDVPAANTIVSNGEIVDIGGWTDGSRVDAYLDGPAGFGEGIGSAEVDKPRPDVSRLTGRSDSGFDLSWQPLNLTAGSHTLYVYSLIDGAWFVHTVPVVGEGNVFQQTPWDPDPGMGGRDADTADNSTP
jgi:hypothetical protein